MRVKITPDILLRAYAAGVFPMSEGFDDPGLFWVDPDIRGVMPLDAFHVPGRLARTVRRDIYDIRVDTAFDDVIAACASTRAGRSDTWINQRIRELCRELFDMGHVHTVEAWEHDRLVGGLYGISLGGAFFGESMFHLATDASKVSLVHLVARLIAGGYSLLDTQFQTEHLSQFGTREVAREDYKAMLDVAIKRSDANWMSAGKRMSGAEALAIIRAADVRR